jgi:hypothetical protein
MKHIVILIASLLLVCGCTEKTEDSSKYSTKDEKGQEICIEPRNPYNDSGGHDAGFNWAMEHGELCNGNSDSFNEGCEEYHRQLDEFNRCEERKRSK